MPDADRPIAPCSRNIGTGRTGCPPRLPAEPPLSRLRRLTTSPDFRAGFVEMLPACLGLVPFGLVCGVGAQAAGTDVLAAFGLATIIFSGAAQILALQLYAAGAPLAIVVLTCFVLGLRLLMYSAAMAPHLASLSPRWQRGLAFVLTDQAFAAAIRRFNATHDPREGARYFAGCGAALWITWQTTNLAGYFAGNLIPVSWSLDFAVPLCFIALVAPLMRGLPNVTAAVVAGVAVLAFAGLPMKLNLVAAGVLGIVAGTLAELAGERWKAR
jgi:predicted branched-subunit amino acid permease